MENAEGNQPPAAHVQEVVAKLFPPEGSPQRSLSGLQCRVELVGRLIKLISKRKSWEQVEPLMAELA